MLSGIKTGKKKKKQQSFPVHMPESSISGPKKVPGTTNTIKSNQQYDNDNEWVAEQLRQSMAVGLAPGHTPSLKQGDSITANNNNDDRVVVLRSSSHTTGITVGETKDEYEMTAAELLAHERTIENRQLEAEVQSLLRQKKNKRSYTDQDDDYDYGDQDDHGEMDSRFNKQRHDPHYEQKQQHRERSRQIAMHDRQDQITAKCWWWIDSSRFASHRLLASSEYVTLVMAPPQHSLLPGLHWYLVPVPVTSSLASADETTIWQHIRQFQTALRKYCRHELSTGKEEKGLLFWETVLPSGSHTTSSFWQTKLEVLVVPKSVQLDAPMYFHNALSEIEADRSMIKTSRQKPLFRSIPSHPNFSYFYVEFGDEEDDAVTGYVQMIESRSFPKDLGIDTIAGMMHMEPLRFRNRESPGYSEQSVIAQFRERWNRQYDPWKNQSTATPDGR